MSLPERLGRLRRVERIGAGGFATVWLYHDDELDSPVAVKALADNWAQRQDVHDRFLEEARILRRADSDHVVRVYDIGEVDGTPYFVMSYADRGTVADLVEPGVPLPPDRVVDLLAQAGEGVAVLHRNGVIHRDIKPQNLLLRSTPDGGEQVLVADLGVAKAMLHASGLTQVVGTPSYMAPEQANGIGLDQRADVHALGAVGYQLLTGRLVREGGFGALAQPVLPPAPSTVAAVPPALDPVVLRALAVDPEDRWPDVPSLVAGLRRAQQAAPPPPAPATRSEPPRARVLPLVLLSLAVLLVSFGAAYGVTRLVDRDPAGAGADPSGQEPSAGEPTDAPAEDIDFPALDLPGDQAWDTHAVRSGDATWTYPVPAGWVPYRGDDSVVPALRVDEQREVRWRPEGEPVLGGHSLRVEALEPSAPVAAMVEQKVAALEGSPDLRAVDVYEQTGDSVYFTYRDGTDHLRYNFFRWVGDDAGDAALEISVVGRRVDAAGLRDLLDRVAGDAAQ
ncbi:MAG TPA: serine/threonine-protein kinase [Nocardioides sp.]|nr:serine/threonine-protein kinase [Nocardioides sp.]